MTLFSKMAYCGQMAQSMMPDGTYLLPVMVKVTAKITKKAVLLQSQEVHEGRGLKSTTTYIEQRCLCKHPGGVVEISSDNFMQLAAARVATRRSISRFDQADDNNSH